MCRKHLFIFNVHLKNNFQAYKSELKYLVFNWLEGDVELEYKYISFREILQ